MWPKVERGFYHQSLEVGKRAIKRTLTHGMGAVVPKARVELARGFHPNGF